MKKLVIALAISLAFPAVAVAQGYAPVPPGPDRTKQFRAFNHEHGPRFLFTRNVNALVLHHLLQEHPKFFPPGPDNVGQQGLVCFAVAGDPLEAEKLRAAFKPGFLNGIAVGAMDLMGPEIYGEFQEMCRTPPSR